MLKRVALAGVVFLVLCAVAVGIAFAGSDARIAGGVKIAGVDVGGLTPADAERLLSRRYAEFAKHPLVVTAGGRKFLANAGELGVLPDWKAAIARAREHGNGFGPIRGFRRLYLRLTGVEVAAPARAYQPALDLFLAKLARTVDIPHHEAALRLHGLDVSVVPAKTGRALDQRAAARAILASFASFSRAPVPLPFRIDKPRVTTAHIRKIAVNAHTALSAPVRLALG